ncbi:hypothetical protein WG68_01090 [Arsukibacterium ikkense]|uniref:Protein kinase domain-containing protein n=1 Tax=Arsukibacterium ikkense TaxID=336831 RepID=A0A0M2V9J3_9GAMM|nr:hypothetical protein [Arsukibacterium ikkense]KKO47271.1 hypothetical protein WG68_01090 [Arsukibacterium ikkense]
MTPELQEKLLIRLFSSLEYTEQFVEDFTQFIDTGLLALEHYDALPVKPINVANYAEVKKDAELWHLKVKPNFLGMKQGMLEALEKARQGDFSYVMADAGNFRSLSKDMDGIREAFMDYIEPELKHHYFELWKKTDYRATNIYLTFMDFWKPGQPLKESITGPIDERWLLKHFQPGEQP